MRHYQDDVPNRAQRIGGTRKTAASGFLANHGARRNNEAHSCSTKAPSRDQLSSGGKRQLAATQQVIGLPRVAASRRRNLRIAGD